MQHSLHCLLVLLDSGLTLAASRAASCADARLRGAWGRKGAGRYRGPGGGRVCGVGVTGMVKRPSGAGGGW